MFNLNAYICLFCLVESVQVWWKQCTPWRHNLQDFWFGNEAFVEFSYDWDKKGEFQSFMTTEFFLSWPNKTILLEFYVFSANLFV